LYRASSEARVSKLVEQALMPAKSQARSRSRLIVVSNDGMPPEFYRRPEQFGVKLPNLMELARTGATADSVESIYPTTTYPAHATLVTGVVPRVHGISSHLASLDPTERARPWHWFAPAIRVPALWNATRAAGRRTAAIGWPVSAGAGIDANVPEIWDPSVPDPHLDMETVARHSTPGLFAELVKALRPIVGSTLPDRLRAEAALYLWQRYQPDLLLVHLVEYDKQAHETGPYSREALAALERSDQEIGRFRDAAGDRGETTLVVLSDHGFVPVENEAAPLVVLSEEGLFARCDSQWELKRLGAIHSGGSFALYWLESPRAEDRRALDRALDRLSESRALAEVIDRSRLESLGADPDAEMVLEAASGYYFSDRFEGPITCPSRRDRGTHGYLPTHRGMEAAFLVTGRGVAPRKNVGRVSLAQVGRTLMQLLGLSRETMACEESPIELG